ncbi:hypothetical protein [Mitsuokella sp. oral taxon 131]|uniref:hypothetical protein n=1 Tax=Mitsuokella sp. oral taxon 131 TaxID=1321780 RepID=UPI0003AE7A55|nr:hypothetical protein [Mitsuokella sp. oral taxon 131]ERL03405.1 hypothetical protein HMPREF1985_02122 [Mitsuokella sp. oral taxon 131 str. W9106]
MKAFSYVATAALSAALLANPAYIYAEGAGEASVKTTEQAPAAEASMKEPAAKASAEEPAAEASKKEPAAKTSAKEPAAEASKKGHAAKASAKEPAAEASEKGHAAKASAKEPAAEASKKGHAAKASAEEPSTEKAMRQSTQADVALPYTYTSKEYGFTIQCPQKPVGVIPASALYEGEKGDVLVFENDAYNIKYAWIITEDAFDDAKVPDLNTLDEKAAKELLKGIMGSNGYEGIMLVNLSKTNKAIYAVTAKEVEIDTNGDGVPDETGKADTQMAVLFFRGEKGGRYAIKLIDNPVLRGSALAAFQKGAATFQEK